MKARWIGALAAGAMLSSPPASADVRVTIGDGHVSVSAANATVRQILAEWAKVGQTRIVNLERVAGPPTTIEISNASEIETLDILLRSVGGYIIAPRQVELPNASRFDRIVILPASSVPAPTIGRPAAPAPAPRTAPLPQPPSQLLPPPRRLDEENDDSDEPVPAAVPGQRPAMFNAFPAARGGTPPQPGQEVGVAASPPPPPVAPSSMPTAPAGVPVPGMVIPTPQPAPGAAQPR